MAQNEYLQSGIANVTHEKSCCKLCTLTFCLLVLFPFLSDIGRRVRILCLSQKTVELVGRKKEIADSANETGGYDYPRRSCFDRESWPSVARNQHFRFANSLQHLIYG